MAEVIAVETPSLGDRSYLARDGNVAAVIDPQRDTDRITALAAANGTRITHVAETHIHNDYVSGGLALSRLAGAAYLVNDADPVRFERVGVRDGDIIGISPRMRLHVLATPGHTFSHLSYALEAAGSVTGVFTGGSLLFGSTGRPDLLGPGNTGPLVHAQYASAQRLARELPDTAQIYPTHGFGSYCAATQAQAAWSTIGREQQINPVLTMGEQAYVDALLAGLDAYPTYYAHMGPANLAGPGAADLTPPRPADPEEIRSRIDAGEWVIDLRSRTAFAAGFLRGSLCFPLDRNFASYLGWAMPWGTPLTLLGDSAQQVALAQRDLARIGIDRPAAAASGGPQRWAAGQALATIRLARFADLAAAMAEPGGRQDMLVLDVRRQLEWEDGHVSGAIHIPFSQLPSRAGEIPAGEVWVYCHTGYRATVAASMLAASGRQVISVDDEFGNAEGTGLPILRSLRKELRR